MQKTNQSGFWIMTFIFMALKIGIHLLTNTNYELHRDAYLYLAQGDHLSWGYLSVPPLTAFLSKLLRFITGDSAFAVRLFPTLIGGASVIVVNLIVREMGGRRWAMVLASLAFICSPAFLRSNMLLQPVSLNQFFWLTAFYFVVRLINTRDPKYWLYLSINFALGFLTKYAIIFLAAGFFIALLLTPSRRLLKSKYFVYGLILGVLLIMPNLVWQHNNSWPVIYHMEMLRQYHLVNVQLADFLSAQLIMHLPVTFFWLTGLIYLLFYREMYKYRIVGFTFLAVLILLLLTRGKSYYTIGLYSVLFAAGGVVFEKFIRRTIWAYASLVFMIITLSIMLPFSLPVLGHERMLEFCQKSIEIGVDMPMRWEDGQVHSLPQDYADMIGWKELAENVMHVYDLVPAAQKTHCYIYAENYGQAGAIRYYGLKNGLPEPICFHGSFIFWAPDDVNDLQYLIYVNDDISGIRDYFGTIDRYDGITTPYARESGLPVYLCKDPAAGFGELYVARLREERMRFMNEP